MVVFVASSALVVEGLIFTRACIEIGVHSRAVKRGRAGAHFQRDSQHTGQLPSNKIRAHKSSKWPQTERRRAALGAQTPENSSRDHPDRLTLVSGTSSCVQRESYYCSVPQVCNSYSNKCDVAEKSQCTGEGWNTFCCAVIWWHCRGSSTHETT